MEQPNLALDPYPSRYGCCHVTCFSSATARQHQNPQVAAEAITPRNTLRAPLHSLRDVGGPNQKQNSIHGGSRPERDGHHPIRPPSRPLQSPTQSRPEPLPPEMGAVIHVTCFSGTTATATQSHNRLQRHLYTDQFSSRTGNLLAERLSRAGWSSPYAENPTFGS